MTKTSSAFFFLSLFVGLLFTGCEKEADPTGHVGITFNHLVKTQPVSFNEMIYENAAGNPYEIKEVQWFISDVTLVSTNGKEVILDQDEFSHYVDTNLPTTLEWSPSDDITTGTYNQLKFTFGIKGEKNIPGLFPDLPESGMVWPYALGGDNGGYHYMKLNGFWKNASDVRTPFNFHLGVGQIYNDNHEVTEFVQNWFEVTLPIELTIRANTPQHIQLNMNINTWFDSPYIYDFNVMGGMTMTNQESMSRIKGNGAHAFSVIVDNN